MNTYNRASVVPDKRDKYLDDAYEMDQAYELDDGPLTDAQMDTIRELSTASDIPRERFSRGLFTK